MPATRAFSGRALCCAALVAAVFSVVLWSMSRAIRAHRLCVLREGLVVQGFPPDYAVRLAELAYAHSAWRFEPLTIGDLPWDAIVDRECTPGWNLVARTTWAPDDREHLGLGNYTPYYAENARTYDSGLWYQASRQAIAYFMDPRNFLNERDVFMFQTLTFDERLDTEDTVERVLAPSFMGAANYDGGSRRFSELLVEVGRAQGLSAVFLATRLVQEQGKGTVQTAGRIGDSLFEISTNETDRAGAVKVWGKTFAKGGKRTAAVLARGRAAYNGYYNFFNIGACGEGLFEIRYNAWKSAVSDETCQRYNGPWTSQERAIAGGAACLKKRYIETRRETRYLQKFSVRADAGTFRWKQYMQNISAPLFEGRCAHGSYEASAALSAPYRFLIPVYRQMPEMPAPDPAEGNSVCSPSD